MNEFAANARWGFAGKTHSLGAYTGEHYEADQGAGIIITTSQECPGGGVDRCRPMRVPSYYRSHITSIEVEQVSPTNAHPLRRPIRSVVLCEDCAAWLWWVDRKKFEEEHGRYRLEDGSRHRDDDRMSQAEIRDALAAMDALVERDWQFIVRVAGEPDTALEWFEIRNMAATVRRYFARYVSAITSTSQKRSVAA